MSRADPLEALDNLEDLREVLLRKSTKWHVSDPAGARQCLLRPTEGSGACCPSVQGRRGFSMRRLVLGCGARVQGATHVSPREHPAPEGRVRKDGDAELAGSGEEAHRLALDDELEGRVLDLHGRDGVHRARPAQRRPVHVGQANVPDLAFPVKMRS